MPVFFALEVVWSDIRGPLEFLGGTIFSFRCGVLCTTSPGKQKEKRKQALKDRKQDVSLTASFVHVEENQQVRKSARHSAR
jgi:hypothetical protein